MLNRFKNPANTVIINATNIGKKFQGIGVYAYNILKELSQLKTNLNFIVYLNKGCANCVTEIRYPENFELRWTTSLISPDLNFNGHVLRLLYSNYLSIKHRRFHIFNTSQMEINFFRAKQIVTIHDIIPLLFRKHHHKQYYFFKLLINFGLKRAQYIITPSNHSEKLLKKIYNLADTRIKVIHNGADSCTGGMKEPVANLPDKFILYLGRINKMKNLGNLLKAYYKIIKKIDHKLVIVGNDYHSFQKELDSANLYFQEEQIQFIENVSEKQKNYVYSRASLFVFPSLYEGFGLPPIEAMASGCPVIVSNNSSLPEVCGDAAFYIDPEDVNQISKAILEVLTDSALSLKMSSAGIRRAKMFTWYFSGIMHLNTIENVISYNRLPAEGKLSLMHSQNNSHSLEIPRAV